MISGVCKAMSWLLHSCRQAVRADSLEEIYFSNCAALLFSSKSLQNPAWKLSWLVRERCQLLYHLFCAQFQDLRGGIWGESELRGKPAIHGVTWTGWLYRQKMRLDIKRHLSRAARSRYLEGALWILGPLTLMVSQENLGQLRPVRSHQVVLGNTTT